MSSGEKRQSEVDYERVLKFRRIQEFFNNKEERLRVAIQDLENKSGSFWAHFVNRCALNIPQQLNKVLPKRWAVTEYKEPHHKFADNEYAQNEMRTSNDRVSEALIIERKNKSLFKLIANIPEHAELYERYVGEQGVQDILNNKNAFEFDFDAVGMYVLTANLICVDNNYSLMDLSAMVLWDVFDTVLKEVRDNNPVGYTVFLPISVDLISVSENKRLEIDGHAYAMGVYYDHSIGIMRFYLVDSNINYNNNFDMKELFDALEGKDTYLIQTSQTRDAKSMPRMLRDQFSLCGTQAARDTR